MVRYFYAKNGNEHGPCGAAELVALAKQGLIGPDDLVRKEGGDFVRAGKVRGLVFGQSPANGSVPPPLPLHAVLGQGRVPAGPPVAAGHGTVPPPVSRDREPRGQGAPKNKRRRPTAPAVAAPSTGSDVLGFVILGVFGLGVIWIGSGVLSLVGCGRPSASSPASHPAQAHVAPDGMTASRVVRHLVQEQAASVANDIFQMCRDAARGLPDANLAVPLEFTVHNRTVELMTIEFTNALKPFGEDLSGVPAERVNAAVLEATKTLSSRLVDEFVNPVLSKKFRPR